MRGPLEVERLEDRTCPSGTWDWIGSQVGGASLPWSNPDGGYWKHDGIVTGKNQYPGMSDSTNDVVQFNDDTTNPATLNVALANPIQSLESTAWDSTLTLNYNLTVSGTAGDFKLSDNSDISLATNVALNLTSLAGGAAGQNLWTSGSITGAANSTLNVYGTYLELRGAPFSLGTNLVVGQDVGMTAGVVELSSMTGNLLLSGTANYIDVSSGGKLYLNQNIAVAGDQNLMGGLALAAGHTGTLAVQVETAGKLERDGWAGVPATPNQVMIGGAVYNVGGTVEVDAATMLNITGKDASGYSYWQKSGTGAVLQLDNGANINAAGVYEIDAGLVQFTAPSGGSADELDGAGLVFGVNSTAKLKIVDSTPGTPGTVIVQGPVTLSASTQTTMNYNTTTNTSDLLDVKNGTLTLNGTLSLNGDKMLKDLLILFEDDGATAAINGGFTSIMDNFADPLSGTVVGTPPTVKYDVQPIWP